MTIQDPEKFCAGLWDWKILEGCFGNTRIMPTDCEGIVERNGYFLYFETKSPGANVPEGQRIFIKSLVATGKFTVFILWGRKNQPERVQVYTRHTEHAPESCDVQRLRKLVTSWFRFANGHTQD